MLSYQLAFIILAVIFIVTSSFFCAKKRVVYLTIIPRACVGYEMVDTQRARSAELAMTISHPTSASGIIVLLKTPKRIAIFELPSCFR